MKGMWQVAGCLALIAAVAIAEEPTKTFTWVPPQVGPGIFTNDLGMLGSERDDYATNLAVYATNRVVTEKASPASLEDARRLLALSLHLSPRNRKALVGVFQLGKGILPEKSESEYSPQGFARLLFTRGQLLQKQGGSENTRLARIFIEISATIDPKNEDAVYTSEVQRLDHGGVDWKSLTDFSGKEKPAASSQTP